MRCAFVAIALLAAAEAHAFDAGATLDSVWSATRATLFDTTLVARYFNEEDHLRLREHLRSVPDVSTLADSINRYYEQLHVSHTRMVTADDLEFYLYGSAWSPFNLDTLQVPHIGIQWARQGNSYVIRNLLEGYPAQRAGLRRGDIIVSANGRPFHPLRSFGDGNVQLLTVRRGLRNVAIQVQPIRESPMRSLFEAMRSSVRQIEVGTHRVGYIHLWTCLNPLIQQEFARLVRDSLGTADGIVLDLRDGVGGGWESFLDPFFPDRSGYAAMTVTSRALGPTFLKPTLVRFPWIDPHPCFSGPMVVLINEGTRSGKEGIAYQMKKSKRARLVGVTTAGAFRGGMFHLGRDEGYILIVAWSHLLLDGEDLEGHGVTPDVEVRFPLESHASGDPQMDRALAEIRGMLGAP